MGAPSNTLAFEVEKLHESFASSVGRAVDCSWTSTRQTSIGRWFESGWKDFFSCDFEFCLISKREDNAELCHGSVLVHYLSLRFGEAPYYVPYIRKP